MIDALTGTTLWGSLGVIALAVWATGRIATHLTGNPHGVQIVARLATPVVLVFALSFVLMARFQPWRVAVGLAGAGALAVVVWTIVGTRSEAGHGMAGLAALGTATWAIFAVPLTAVVCSLLAWLVGRHPPPPLAWGIVVAALCAAAAAPTVARLRSPEGGRPRGDAPTSSAPPQQSQEPDVSSR